MDLLTLIVAIVGIVLVTVQGCLCFVGQNQRYIIGALNLILAAIATTVVAGLRLGIIVLAPEFGAVMAQGTSSMWILAACLTGVALLPALAWQQIRDLIQWKRWLFWAVLASFAVGGWAASQAFVVNPGATANLQIWLYDVWWPPLILWFTACAAGIAVALVASEDASAGALLLSALITPLAYFALLFQDLPPLPREHAWFQTDLLWLQARAMWKFLKHAAFFSTVLLLTYSAVKEEGVKKPKSVITFAASAAVCLAIIGISFRTLYEPLWTKLAEALPFVLVLGAFLYTVAAQFYEGGKPAQSPNALQAGLRKLLHQPAAGVSLRGVLFVLAVPVIGIGLIDLFSIGLMPRSLDIAALFCFWLLFAEHLAERSLNEYPKDLRELLNLVAVDKIRGWTSAALKRSYDSAAALKSVLWDSPENSTKIMKRIATTLLAPILTLVFLIAVNEIVDYQSIVVHEIQVVGPTDEKEDAVIGIAKDFGQVLSGGLINELGRLRADLRADLILAQRESSGEHPNNVSLTAAADSNVETAFAKSDDVTIGGVKVPLNFFVRPIQHFVDSLLGIRVVQGSVRKIPSAKGGVSYVVLLNTSDGGSWKVYGDAKEPPASACPPDPDDRNIDLIERLVESMAFKVASTDPSFLASGLTHNADAFEIFRTGLAHWNRLSQYENGEESRKTLAAAISCFGAALKIDRSFALAHYRLGVALQRQGRPSAALEEFNASLSANSAFIPAMLVAASSLYDFRDFSERPSAAVGLVRTSEDQQARASRIWAALLDLPEDDTSISERRAAYAGLCQAELDARLNSNDPEPSSVPYFLCSRANSSYYRLPNFSRRGEDENRLQARIFNNLGLSLASHNLTTPTWDIAGSGERWSCDGSRLEPIPLSVGGLWKFRNLYSALRYYGRSLRLLPTDDWVRCNAADAEAQLGHPQAMRALFGRAAQRLNLGNQLEEQANLLAHPPDEGLPSLWDRRDATDFFRRAVQEFDAAVKAEPASIDALNDYAYVFWEWKMDSLEDRTTEGPDAVTSFQAERYAREAVKLAEIRGKEASAWMTEGTLGEVLLGQGRVAEAIEELGKPAEHDSEHETRWDLVQAQTCLFRGTRDGQAFKKATAQFGKIDSNSMDFELPPFWTARSVLETLVAAPCPQPPDPRAPDPGRPVRFKADKPSYSAGPGCAWTSASATVYLDNKIAGNYTLHVWGRGIDTRKNAAAAESILLDQPPLKRDEGYYAQLEKDYAPVSEAVALPTRSECSANQAALVFRGTSGQKPAKSAEASATVH